MAPLLYQQQILHNTMGHFISITTIYLVAYMRKDSFSRGIPLDICPVGGAFEKRPEPYTWNIEFSGRSTKDADQWTLDTWLVKCPYHDWNSGIYWYDLQETSAHPQLLQDESENNAGNE